jgi:hypothetical protein
LIDSTALKTETKTRVIEAVVVTRTKVMETVVVKTETETRAIEAMVV